MKKKNAQHFPPRSLKRLVNNTFKYLLYITVFVLNLKNKNELKNENKLKIVPEIGVFR